MCAKSLAKAKKNLDWAPTVSFEQLAQLMYDADVALARKEVK